jgi:hypothetical protein
MTKLTNDELREAIARVIDPEGWAAVDRFLLNGGEALYGSRQAAIDASFNAGPSLAKADAILALIPAERALLDEVERLKTERDEAIRDRDAHAEHVRRVAREAEDGFAALEMIDRCWDACGYPTNRRHVTLEEQVLAMAHQIHDPEFLLTEGEKKDG